ncbi:PREDICTED: U1 small nuclear ribonucleoprotein C-like isoform X2 [Ipomoea nil]|uniref:U1 small nuclear ribonucleoprotein C-like isoform X2 n=1 Tax=Ipomoea nil TaxID=35883 RepID=UPI000901412D|nr:PREDICTED: U1 small nuclear ribonucleoprotein C-like isoform X2 [Ipomoea nil]
MPRYYCDYCDTYLTHDSPSVRKQHNSGYKHKANVRSYYQQYEAQLNQSLIDQRVKEHLVAFRAPAPPYAQMRPGLPVFPAPGQIPMPGNPQLPAGTHLIPGVRPPMLRPLPGAPGYVSGPPMPSMMAPPGAPIPGQLNSLPRPPMGTPTSLPGSAGMTTPTGPPPMYAPPPPMPQGGGIPVPTSAAGDNSSNSHVPPEPNH